MKKSELVQIIREEIQAAVQEYAKVGDPSNWHGTDESQRSWVMKLAAKDALGIISLSRIADALDVPRQAIHNTYGRIIRHYEDKHDFKMIIPNVPFQSEAVYQLIGTPPLSEEDMQKVEAEEAKLYKKTTGVYYSIRLHQKLNAAMPLICWLNLSKGENPEPYFAKIPDRDSYHISTKPLEKGPKQGETIVTKDDWDAFVRDNM